MKISKLIDYLIPPNPWKLPVAGILAVFVGLVCYSIYVSNAVSYISDDPKTCVNCHIMAPQYATWQHSSHREVATCNDCHVPQDNVVKKYYFKAMDGLRHATIFTMRAEPQVIQIKEDGIGAVQENCKRCHASVNQDIGLLKVTRQNNLHGEGKLCWECHREVPHGRVNSLNSTPFARVPLLESPVPEWLKELQKENK